MTTPSSSLTEFQKLYWQVYHAGMYDIEVKTTTVDALNEKGAAAYSDVLKDYNMVILGFDDLYKELTVSSAKAIVEYIGTGKALLFTHDTTSYWNDSTYPNGGGNNPGWGYQFNQIVRDKVGLDRYGVTSSVFVTESQNDIDVHDMLTNGNENQILGDTVTYIQGANSEKAKYTVAYMPGEDVTYEGKTQGKSAGATQGFTNSIIDKYIVGSPANTNKDTTTVSQVNQGQITEYPYELPVEFGISPTHSQYYQLNMNADDVVVWYCLGGEKTSSQYDDYSDEKNDASNAYYIYNRGNITYSGAGHVESLSSQEAMLFVNTMIAAYRAGTGAAGVSFRTAADDPASTLLFPVQIADETDENGKRETYTLSGEQSTYFKISDRNLTEGNTLSVELYYEVADQTTTNREDGAIKIRDDATGNYTPYVVNVSITDDDIYRADTTASADPDNLISDVLYKMVIPPAVLDYVTRLQGDGKIYLVATTTIHSDAGDTTYRSFDDLTLKKLGLLRLE
jgi:hypothetical protein